MAPKRNSGKARVSTSQPRRSKLARENDISNEQEAEISEAFLLFSVHDVPGYEREKDMGVLRIEDVRRVLIALGLQIPQHDIVSHLDPAGTGFVSYTPFLSFAAAHLHHSATDADAEDQEVHDAYNLFTHNGSGPITLAHLRRVAKELKEDVSDEVLKDMIVEANGEARREGWRRGVDVGEFEGVLRRAGVFS